MIAEPSRDLSAEELTRFVAELARTRNEWEHLIRHDPRARVYEQLPCGPHVDVWLICWRDEQDTGFHDHDLSCGAVSVVEGRVCEQRLVLGGRPVERTFAAGASFHFDASVIHRVRHIGPAPAVTLHAYSPPLARMGTYRTGGAGELIRETIPYTEELVPSR